MICHINLAKSFRGGERQTSLLINELDIEQCLIIRKGSPLKNYIKNNVKIIEITKPFIFHIFKLKHCSLIHAHEAKAAQLSFFAHIILKKPYIITRRVCFPIKQNFFTQAIYKKASAIIAISQAVKQKIAQDTGINSSYVIPSAITPDTTTNNLTALKNRFKDNFIVLNIAALNDKDKGQLDIIEAAKELSDITFLLVGKGKDEKILKKIAPSNVIFEGFKKNIYDYLEIADIFLFPSRREGLGSILLDAMKAKKPIITRAVGGIPELLDENSAIFINSPNDIKKAILTLKNNKKLRDTLALNAFEKSKKFDIKHLAPKILNIYENVLK